MVRRLFGLTDIFDSWKTGTPIPGKSRAFSLKDVTLYTSLESCAQCSGVMSLGGVKQVIYLQNDFTAYMIGNIMFNLANRVSGPPGASSLPGAPIPIPASAVGLQQFKDLNDENLKFVDAILKAKNQYEKNQNDKSGAFYVPPDDGPPDFAPSITSFLCTDAANRIFSKGADKLDSEPLAFPNERYPNEPSVLPNRRCLDEAREFFKYADVEGYRGSPHKL